MFNPRRLIKMSKPLVKYVSTKIIGCPTETPAHIMRIISQPKDFAKVNIRWLIEKILKLYSSNGRTKVRQKVKMLLVMIESGQNLLYGVTNALP